MLGNKPVDFGQAYLGWHTDLLPAYHSQTKPCEGCPCFRRQSMEAPTAALALRLDCRVRTSRTSNWANFRIWKRCFFVSLVLNSVHKHHCHLQTETFPAFSYTVTTSMISSSTSAKRSVACLGATLRHTNSCACSRKSPV